VDADVLELPIFVRLDYEASEAGDVGEDSNNGKDKKEKRELAYWSVIGVGRLANA